MGLINFLFKQKRSNDTITMNPVVVPPGIYPTGDERVDVLTSSTIACLKRCLEIKCGSVAALGLHVEKLVNEGERKYYVRDAGHPFEPLLSAVPNSRQNAYDFVWQMVWNREMIGDAYVIPRYYAGSLTGLVLIPGECSVHYEPTTGLYTVSDTYDGIFGDFTEDQIIHIKSYSTDGFIGQPLTELARTIINIARKTYRQQSDMFTPGSTLRGFITGDDSLNVGFGGSSDSQLETVTKRIRTELSRGTNLGYLPGSMKFVATGMTPSDLQLNDAIKTINLEVCRMIGVPPTQAFQDSNVNYKSSESSQSIFYVSTLSPLTKQIEAEFNTKLFTASERKKRRIVFDTSNYYQSDPTVLYNAVGNLVQRGVLTPNDAREMIGKAPVDGGDKLMVIGGKAVGDGESGNNSSDNADGNGDNNGSENPQKAGNGENSDNSASRSADKTVRKTPKSSNIRKVKK